MSRMIRWLDQTFIPNNLEKLLDFKCIPDELRYLPEVYIVKIYDDSKENKKPAKDRWEKSWISKDVNGHNIVNVYTSFDMALADYWRESEAHPKSIMRVERRNLDSIVSGKTWEVRLISVYGDCTYLCDGKTAFPNDYWKRWPQQYPEKVKEEAGKEKANEKKEEDKFPIGFAIPQTDPNSKPEIVDDEPKEPKKQEKPKEPKKRTTKKQEKKEEKA